LFQQEFHPGPVRFHANRFLFSEFMIKTSGPHDARGHTARARMLRLEGIGRISQDDVSAGRL
jgi:hypothetical protein